MKALLAWSRTHQSKYKSPSKNPKRHEMPLVKTRKSCFSYRTGFHCYTVLLLLFKIDSTVLLFLQSFYCSFEVFTVSSMFLLHCCSYEVSTASLKLLLFQQISHCIAVHTSITKWFSVWWVVNGMWFEKWINWCKEMIRCEYKIRNQISLEMNNRRVNQMC